MFRWPQIFRVPFSFPERTLDVLSQRNLGTPCVSHHFERNCQYVHCRGQSTKVIIKLNQTHTVCAQRDARMQTLIDCRRPLPCTRLGRYLSGSKYSGGPRDQAEDEKFSALAQQVLDVTRQRDVMAASVQPQALATLLRELCQAGCPLRPTVDLLTGRLWLIQDGESVLSIVETIMQQGFNWQVALELLETLPPEYCIQDRPLAEIPEMVNASVHQLRDLGFSSRNLSHLVSRSPHVFLVPTKSLVSVLRRLKGLFTKADAMKVAVACPSVFSQAWTETNKIFDYAFFTMGYTQPQLVQSEVLAFPLHKLQDRHIFLTRAGFFVQVKQKDDPRLNPNPPLRFVVAASDADFASEFGGLSQEEYGTFLAMREREREEEEDADSEGNSDSSDSESDNPDGRKER